MTTKKDKVFKQFDESLKTIAFMSRHLVELGECEWSEIDEFISETGNKHMTEVRSMDKKEFILASLKDVLEGMTNETLQSKKK
jgi:hypothetical protein